MQRGHNRERRYVQYINRSYRRTGTLWDSRYKSSLVQAETYLLACQRRAFGRVSYERVVSGPGLLRILNFLQDSGAGMPSQ